MLRQYSTLTRCIAVLNQSSMPAIEKLKLEVQLIKTKLALLYPEVESRISGVVSSESKFDELYIRILDVCSSEDGRANLGTVTSLIDEIRQSLKPVTSQEPARGNKVLDIAFARFFRNGFY